MQNNRINYNSNSPPKQSNSDKKRYEQIFIAQHSTCLQQELNSQYSIDKFNKPLKSNQINLNSISSQDNYYTPREQSKYYKNTTTSMSSNHKKDSFSKARIFQESPLSIKHLDSIGESENDNYNHNHINNKNNINNNKKTIENLNYKSIQNESQSNLQNNFKDIFKAQSVETTPKYLKRKIHYVLNDKSYQYEEDKDQDKYQSFQNKSMDDDFFFTTASFDNPHNHYNNNQASQIDGNEDDEIQMKKRIKKATRRNIKRDQNLYSVGNNDNYKNNNDEDNNINKQNKKINNSNSIESITKKHENYQTRQSRKLLKLPKISNQLSKSLLKSYKECQNSMEELGSMERSISQKSIFQYDLMLPQNQQKLVSQKSKWENRALEYINEKKYQNFQDRQKFQIFNDGIDKRIHRYYIDEEQKRKNILVKKLEQAMQINQKKHFQSEQKRGNFRDEIFYKKYGKPIQSNQKEYDQNNNSNINENDENIITSQFHQDNKFNNNTNNNIKKNNIPQLNLYSPLPQQNNNQNYNKNIKSQQNSLETTPRSNRKQKKEFSYEELLKEENDSSLNDMLTAKLSQIAYTKRSKTKNNTEISNQFTMLTPKKINQINFPLQEFLSKKKNDKNQSQVSMSLQSSPQNYQNKINSLILKEENVELNSPLAYHKNRQL